MHEVDAGTANSTILIHGIIAFDADPYDPAFKESVEQKSLFYFLRNEPLESIGAVWRRITERSRAGNQFGDEAPSGRTEREPPMGMAEGEP